MTERAKQSQLEAKKMIDHYAKIGAVVIEQRNEQEKLRKAVEQSSGLPLRKWRRR